MPKSSYFPLIAPSGTELPERSGLELAAKLKHKWSYISPQWIVTSSYKIPVLLTHIAQAQRILPAFPANHESTGTYR